MTTVIRTRILSTHRWWPRCAQHNHALICVSNQGINERAATPNGPPVSDGFSDPDSLLGPAWHGTSVPERSGSTCTAWHVRVEPSVPRCSWYSSTSSFWWVPTRCPWPDAGSMLARRRRRRANIKTALGQHLFWVVYIMFASAIRVYSTGVLPWPKAKRQKPKDISEDAWPVSCCWPLALQDRQIRRKRSS